MLRSLIIAATVIIAASGIGNAAELIVFEQEGCPWCARWDREIAPAYPKTEQGQIAPLRRVDVDGSLPPDLAFLETERFTPTFVVVHDGREYGRIRGYPGDEFFWVLLDEILRKLPPEAHASRPPGRG